MSKVIALSDKHSNYNGKNLFIELQGGSPWFGYIWIDDVCYAIFMGPRKSFTIKKTKIGK